MDGLVFFAVLLAAVIVWLLSRRSSPKRKKSRPSPVEGVPMHLWERLLKICLGDKQRARRLIRAEQERKHGITPHKACRIAIERYIADNR